MTPVTSLAAAQLAIYTSLLVPVGCVLMQHGKRGLMAWLSLLAFLLLRITGSALQIVDPASTGAHIIAGVGLSPLSLTFVGLMHEVNAYTKGQKPFWAKWQIAVLLHFAVSTAIALVVVGATGHKSNSATFQRVGYIVFIAVFVAISGLLTLSWKEKRESVLAKKLLIGTSLALPFLGIRILYSLIASFVTSINAYTGPIAYRMVLSVLMELLAVIILCMFGMLTRHIDAEGMKPTEIGSTELRNKRDAVRRELLEDERRL